MYDRSNLQALCLECHGRKSAYERHNTSVAEKSAKMKRSVWVGVDGYGEEYD